MPPGNATPWHINMGGPLRAAPHQHMPIYDVFAETHCLALLIRGMGSAALTFTTHIYPYMACSLELPVLPHQHRSSRCDSTAISVIVAAIGKGLFCGSRWGRTVVVKYTTHAARALHCAAMVVWFEGSPLHAVKICTCFKSLASILTFV